jgi:hypothetical protein
MQHLFLVFMTFFSSLFVHHTQSSVKSNNIIPPTIPTATPSATPTMTLIFTPTVNPYQMQLKSNLENRLGEINTELTQEQDRLQTFMQLSKQQEDDMQQQMNNILKNGGEGGVHVLPGALAEPLLEFHNSNQQKIQNMNAQIETLQEEKTQILIQLAQL